jgi:hypothetical protein
MKRKPSWDSNGQKNAKVAIGNELIGYLLKVPYGENSAPTMADPSGRRSKGFAKPYEIGYKRNNGRKIAGDLPIRRPPLGNKRLCCPLEPG